VYDGLLRVANCTSVADIRALRSILSTISNFRLRRECRNFVFGRAFGKRNGEDSTRVSDGESKYWNSWLCQGGVAGTAGDEALERMLRTGGMIIGRTGVLAKRS
jgi:hypothetical protein